MPRRKHKKYNKPRKLFDINVIKEEKNLIKKYGLKNRREVWRANYYIGKLRNIAKGLIKAEEELKIEFIERQKEKGFNVNTIADVLALNKEDYLKRRLQSVVFSRGLAKTYKQARQLITHRGVSLNGNKIDSPSHLTTIEEENNLSLKKMVTKPLLEEDKKILRAMKENE